MLRGAEGWSRLELARYLASGAYSRLTGGGVNQREVDLKLSGFDVRVQTFSSQLGSYADIFFLDEYEKVPGFESQPGQTVVDAGANVGFFTLRHARDVGPSGRVFAFEPNPSVFRLLQHNVERNGLKQVSCHRSALGERVGSLLFTSDPRSTSCGHISESEETGEPVPVSTLDALVEEQGLTCIDLLKLDVEGYEPHVLRGGAQRALACTRRVVMESHLTRDIAWDILRPLGFRKAYDGFNPNVVYFTRELG
ncbi:MAG TPA: FkbM family methyltransferase [Polyangiaceae bacterium]|nr:FkbM family methyltransferase [Polyangiaceae bacterium]